MKCLFILSILITLSQSRDDKDDSFLKAGKKTIALLQHYINTGKHLNKYLGKKGVKDAMDVQLAKSKANIVKRVRRPTDISEDFEVSNLVANDNQDSKLLNGFRMDPILNMAKRRRYSDTDAIYTDSNSRSSSRELKDWKTEWREHWLKQRVETWNNTTPRGDVINMVAARPWGVPCGDPTQHDMPWGTCVLPVECDAEYRIYRGDYFCARTSFICCGLAFSTYDTYQAFDVSMQDSQLQTDSEELRERKIQAATESKDKAIRDKRQRQRIREARKRKIRNTIRNIVAEVKRILNRAYRNGTRQKKKKTRTMKNFIRYLKQKYKKDRASVKEIHENQMYEVDSDLLNKLVDISEVNANFMTNDTFRQILLNRTMTASSAGMLVKAYPELASLINRDILRRAGIFKSPNEVANFRSFDDNLGQVDNGTGVTEQAEDATPTELVDNQTTDEPETSDVTSTASDQAGNQTVVTEQGGYATLPTGLKIRRSGDGMQLEALRRRLRATRRSGAGMQRVREALRRSRDALRRSRKALRQRLGAMRRSSLVTQPYRRSPKRRDYDVEYGLMYS